mgnify:CR=1 FL=1
MSILLSNQSKVLIPFILILTIVISFSNYTVAGGIDQGIRDIVLESETPTIDVMMSGFTKLGNKETVIPLILFIPDNEMRSDTFKSLLFTTSITATLKSVIGEKRPPGPKEYRHFTTDNEYMAMPSGHATGAFTVATVFSHHYPKYKNYAYTLASLIAVSRLYEDRHWFSNIVAGAGIGYYGANFVLKRW